MGKKRRRKPADKQRRPKRDKGSSPTPALPQGGREKESVSRETSVDELSEQAQAALKLLDQETADAIIGSTDDEYGTLIRGTSAVVSLNWAVMKTHGLKQVPASLKAGAQTMTMILQLVHYAYALGMRRGLEEKPPPNLPLAGGGTEEGGG